MPSDGANCPQKYIDEWKRYAQEYKTEFRYIDNSKEKSTEEVKKLHGSNILVITGGNTFKLLDNLRKSGLDNAIKKLASKEEFVLAGFSAGALVLTPTIKVCNLPNFEVFPHYEETQHKSDLNKYRTTTKNEVKKITNDDYLVINL